MLAIVLSAVLLAGCATRAPVPCETELWVTDPQVAITGECVTGAGERQRLRVICEHLSEKAGCEFRAPPGCLITRLEVRTERDVIRRSPADYPDDHMPQHFCLWLGEPR